MKKILGLLLTSLLLSSSVMADDFRFVQVSDVKFSQNAENSILDNVIKDINKQKDVEFVVFTGDNINKPVKDDLIAFLEKAKKLKCPFYIVLGDKDVNKHKDLNKAEYIKTIRKNVRKYEPQKPNYVFEKKNLVFIVADGSKDVIPTPTGYYKEEVLNWLDAQLELYPNKNVVILQHFPIIPPAQKETYYTYKPEAYLKILAKHKNVKAVIAGHFGVNNEQTVNGILHVATGAAPYYRIIDVLDYETETPTIWAQLKEVN